MPNQPFEVASPFDDADVVVLADIYAASEDPIPGISSELIAEKIRLNGKTQVFCPGSLPTVERFVLDTVKPGDLLLTMGAGDLVKTAHTLAAQLTANGG